MQGTIAITDHRWYEFLAKQKGVDEVNFWKPSATRRFVAEEHSPFIFKLRKSHGNAICGFGFFAAYSSIPDWFAWDSFGICNGCRSLDEMRQRIGRIRERIDYRGNTPNEIGCLLIAHPVFFPREYWVEPPANWPPRTQTHKKYDLSIGEGARVWRDCLEVARRLPSGVVWPQPTADLEVQDRFGSPSWVTPRLGQGTFRVAVADAYDRSCAVTGEHSLPALEAAHIMPYSTGGPHEVPNGLFLRADLHRLFDQGYITITPDYHLHVGVRLKEHFANGRSYYPLDERPIRVPQVQQLQPKREYLEWHNERVFQG